MQEREKAKNKETVDKPEEKTEEKITSDIQEAEQNTELKRAGYISEINGAAVDFELQYRDHETDMKDIINRVIEDYARRGSTAGKLKSVNVYLKPTDFTAYYVVNDSYEGKIALF